MTSASDRTSSLSRARTARVVVLSAPSGAGKTTIARQLLGRHPDWRFSVSATTRPRRDAEIDGRDYHFLDREEFMRCVERGELVEWEEIYGNLYGTLRSEIERALQNDGQTRVVFDIDVKGALAIRRAFPNDAWLIFIAPPSVDELRRRLQGRHTETAEVIERRIERVAMEMEMRGEFDSIVVNDSVERAVEEIEELLGEEEPGA